MHELAGELGIGDDDGYSEWLVELNHLCLRFLDVELESFPSAREETYEYYLHGDSEETYFTQTLLPEIRYEAGTDYIDAMIAQLCKHGFEIGGSFENQDREHAQRPLPSIGDWKLG